MTFDAYPLKQVMDVKKKRVDDAEKVVKEKKSLLEKEQLKLKEAEAIRDEALSHYKDKLTQLRKELDEATTSLKIKQMKDYLKIVKEKLAKEEIKVNEQKKKVENAQLELKKAQDFLREKQKEVEKLDIHKDEWTKEMKIVERKTEEKNQDEIGSTIFYGRKKPSKG
jgi:hypothetical protein